MDNEEMVINITKLSERVDNVSKTNEELRKKYDGLIFWVIGLLGMMVLNIGILLFKK